MDRTNPRLHLLPEERVQLASFLAFSYGLIQGVVKGSKRASIRYLVENAHRLPKTKGTWYFFHKRKNAVLLKDGINLGIKTGLKFGIVGLSFTSIEAILDHYRNKVDAMSTVTASVIVGGTLTIAKGLSRGQVLRSTAGYAVFGTVLGCAEDALGRLRAKLEESEAKKRESEAQVDVAPTNSSTANA